MKNKVILSLVLPFFLAASALAQEAVVPSNFTIKDIRSSGNACRPGTTAVNISDDREAFTVTFSDFVAELGPDALNPRRRSCRLVFDTEQERGWEFAVLGVTVRGFAQLDAGVTGWQEISFGTRGKKVDHTLELQGEMADDYVHSQQLPFVGKWSGCNNGSKNKIKDFEVRSTATLRSSDATANGLLTVDSVDGQLEQVYEIAWRRCGETRKKMLVSCNVQGSNGQSVFAKGTGRSEEAALAKARSHIAQRCARVKEGFGLCDASAAQCSTSSL